MFAELELYQDYRRQSENGSINGRDRSHSPPRRRSLERDDVHSRTQLDQRRRRSRSPNEFRGSTTFRDERRRSRERRPGTGRRFDGEYRRGPSRDDLDRPRQGLLIYLLSFL